MSIVVTISNEANLRKIKEFFGAKDENEAVEPVLEEVIGEFEANQLVNDLPNSFFEDLFAEKTNLSDGESIQAVIKERQSGI
jgi:hypothetical protein